LNAKTKLTWTKHIEETKTKRMKKPNIIRCLAGTKWGADQKILLNAYKAIVESTIRYGETAYGSATNKTLLKLETVQTTGARTALGTFRVTRNTELLKEAGMSTLQHLRQQNIVKTAIKTMTKPNHTLTSYFYRHRTKEYEKRKSLPIPFPKRSKKLLNLIGLGRQSFSQKAKNRIPPWEPNLDKRLDLQLTSLGKEVSSTVAQQQFKYTTKEKYGGANFIFTDGSKIDERVGWAVYRDENNIIREGIPDGSSVFTAELRAIKTAVETTGQNQNMVITNRNGQPERPHCSNEQKKHDN
jgi:hypothetical protein